MTIEKRNVEVATCDACGNTNHTNKMGEFDAGYSVTIVEHKTGTRHEAYACRVTQIGKASRAVLDEWHSNEPPWVGTDDDRDLSAAPVATSAMDTASER